jgi:hypothetical protein
VPFLHPALSQAQYSERVNSLITAVSMTIDARRSSCSTPDKRKSFVVDVAQVHFVLCSEPLRRGLADVFGVRAGLSGLGGLLGRQPDFYSVTSCASQALLDELQYRSMMARYGL